MIDLRRRKSYYRIEKKHDHNGLLNRMMTDHHQFSLRQSIHPLADQNMFALVNAEKYLSTEALASFLKIIQKQAIIVGLILPHNLLVSCWQLLANTKQSSFCSGSISCGVLNKNMLANTNTILLMIDERDINLDRKPDILEKIILNLSFVLVTTHPLMERRLNYWQSEDLLIEKHGGLMLIKQEGVQLHQQIESNLQSLFWNIDSVFKHELQHRKRERKLSTLQVPQRHAYQPMNQEQERESDFKEKITMLCEISLKKNWKMSRGVMCYPFLYLLSIWLSDDPRDPRKLVQNSLVSYCKSLEEEFIRFIQNFKLPLDQLKFRNSVQSEKNSMLFGARKHLTMLENLFPNLQIAVKSLQELQKVFRSKAQEIYEINNSVASKMNAALLEKLYDEIINSKFDTGIPKTIEQFENDFRTLLDAYSSQSFRVSSQLRTFNEFVIQKKGQYADNLSKQLQVGKKKYWTQKEQLEDRLEIQTGALETLQTQLKELQEKRKKIDLQNNLLKTSISELNRKKKVELASQYNSVSRKKFMDQKENKVSKFEVAKEGAKKQNKCCCSIM